MIWIIDVILILLAAIIVFVYARRGFVKSLFGLCKYILSFLLAYLFAPSLGRVLSDKFLLNKINSSIFKFISNNTSSTFDIDSITSKLPSSVINMLTKTGFYDDIVSKYENLSLSEELIQDFSLSIAQPISSFISNTIAYISIFAVCILALSILAFILDKICQLPILNKMNTILGAALGIVCAIIILITICSVMSLIVNMIGINNPNVSADILSEKTIVYRFISKIDIISALMAIIKW